MNDIDTFIGHWIINVPYSFSGSSFENSSRSYFIHENTTVYTEDGISNEFYMFLSSKEVSDVGRNLYLFDPRGERRECSRFFKVMNPYTVNVESIHMNGKDLHIQKTKTSTYFKLWRISINEWSYCGPAKVENTSKTIPIQQSCIQNKGFTHRYTIPQNLLDKTRSYDWEKVEIKTKDYPQRKVRDYFEILSDNFPRKKWNSREKPSPPNIHWGQLKLLLGEIQFLTYLYKHGAGSNIVIYAGAAAGYHLQMLSRMFPTILFILFDPAKFGISPTPNIIIRNEFFTDEIAKIYDGMNIIFISDIRLEARGFEEFERGVHENNLMMEKWVKYIKPVVSMLKFRIPFDRKGEYDYLAGQIHIQKFAPETSAETRLHVIGEKRSPYAVTKYEENMFYFNTEYRNRSFLDKESVYGVNYDTYGTYMILLKYMEEMKLIREHEMTNEIRAKMAAMILEIQYELGKDLLTERFFEWLL